MVNYELTVVLRNKELDVLKDKVRALLAKHNVQIKSEDIWGVRKLAYEIKGEKEGCYCLFDIESPPESVDKLLNDFRFNVDILRNLFVKVS